jgi:hypothetical protein
MSEQKHRVMSRGLNIKQQVNVANATTIIEKYHASSLSTPRYRHSMLPSI